MAVGMVWVVALGAGMLQQLWVWGGGCDSWGCGMGVFRGHGCRMGCCGAQWEAGGAELQEPEG